MTIARVDTLEAAMTAVRRLRPGATNLAMIAAWSSHRYQGLQAGQADAADSPSGGRPYPCCKEKTVVGSRLTAARGGDLEWLWTARET